MKTKLMMTVLLAGGALFAQPRVSIGIGIGGYGAGRYASTAPYVEARPPCPGPDYNWVDGYWDQNRGHNWVAGYWTRPAFHSGYREQSRYNHDRFDRDRDRDRGYRQDDRGRNEYGDAFRGR